MDNLIVASAWSHAKLEYLPWKYKIDYIRDQNTTNFTYLAKRFEFVMEEIKEENEGETAKTVLTNLAKEFKASITVVGYHGRKGEKQDPTVMGSAV